MKLTAFLLGELVILGLLVVLLFGAVLYQPVWIWVAAPLVMLGGFVGIIAWSKSNQRRSRLLVFLCPLAYTIWFLGMGFSLQSGPIGAVPVAGIYYGIGVILLWGHQLLNAKLRPLRTGVQSDLGMGHRKGILPE